MANGWIHDMISSLMKNDYSSNEVSALLETLRAEFRTVSETVLALRNDMHDVKERLSKLETRVQKLEDAIPIAVPSMNVRLANLEAKVGV